MAINIEGLDKAEILRALYNNARPQGMGYLHFTPDDMSIEEARETLKTQKYFDYHKGRVMKIGLPDDLNTLSEGLYDRDNGQGACARIIEGLRK